MLRYHRMTERDARTMDQFAVLTALKTLTWRTQCWVSHLAFISSPVCPKEQQEQKISELRLEEKRRKGANPLSINRLYYLYMKMFSASTSLPCLSTLINRSSCYGNLPNSIMDPQRGAECLREKQVTLVLKVKQRAGITKITTLCSHCHTTDAMDLCLSTSEPSGHHQHKLSYSSTQSAASWGLMQQEQ